MKTSFGAMTGRERLCFVLKYLFMALCVVVALFPIIWVILSSFKTNAEILSNGISLPTHFGFDGLDPHWIWRRSSSSSATA
ncbi:MAG: hypothetical protein ACLSGI_11990 [Butyricicoccaceae bacterium]